MFCCDVGDAATTQPAGSAPLCFDSSGEDAGFSSVSGFPPALSFRSSFQSVTHSTIPPWSLWSLTAPLMQPNTLFRPALDFSIVHTRGKAAWSEAVFPKVLVTQVIHSSIVFMGAQILGNLILFCLLNMGASCQQKLTGNWPRMWEKPFCMHWARCTWTDFQHQESDSGTSPCSLQCQSCWCPQPTLSISQSWMNAKRCMHAGM